MTTRIRGFRLFALSVVGGTALYWLLFHFYVTGTQRVHVPTGPLAFPIVLAVLGLLQWITGLEIRQIDQAWQRLPGYLKIPAFLVGSILFLWGFLWIVAKSLGA